MRKVRRINIEGEERPFPYCEVEHSVVQISNKYYWRHSPLIVSVYCNGREHWLLKSDTSLAKDSRGKHHLAENLVKTVEGVILSKDDDSLIKVGDKFYVYRWVSDDDQQISIMDDRMIFDPREFYLYNKADKVKLSEKHYGSNLYGPKGRTIKVDSVTDGYVFKSDIQPIVKPSGEKVEEFRSRALHLESLNEQENDSLIEVKVGAGKELKLIKTLQGRLSDIDKFVYLPKYGELTTIADEANVMKLLEKKHSRNAAIVENVRADMNYTYSDVGMDENNAQFLDMNYQRHGGGQLFFEGKGKPIISKTFKRVGRKRYTFGIEYETAAGNLSNIDCIKGHFDKFGDRSIPAFEYVTGIMSGDEGMAMIQKQCDILSKKTMVNDECSVHIHIGGFGDPHIDSPSFNRFFSINSIKLGTQIEKDLYKMSPKSRKPGLKYCKTIKEYAGMTTENADNYLASYLFNHGNGPNAMHFDKHYNSKMDIGRWNGSRYRWLNLNHCNSRSRFETIEFRMFAGTTSAEKVSNYLLICLAFVWAVENRQNVIWDKGYTLNSLVSDAYSNSTKIQQQLLTFIADRKKKFKRTKIY